MKILIICLAVLSFSQGFPRPSSNNVNPGNRRQGVHYGYPETPSEPYTSNQATAYSSDPADTNLDTTYPSWSEPAQSTTADQQSTALSQNTAADQNSAQKTTTASPYADPQSQTSERQTETSQAQATQTQTQGSDSSTTTQTQTQAPSTQTQDSVPTGTQTAATQTTAQTPSYEDSSSTSSLANTPASTAQASTETQTPQAQDATAASQPQTSTYETQTSTQSPAQSQASNVQDSSSTSSQSQAYNQNNGSNEYVNPPQPYNAEQNEQNNPQSGTASQTASQTPKSSYNPQGNDVPDNTQYQVENVTSKTVPDSGQSKASSPVYLSSGATANIADSSRSDDKTKSPTVNKETTVRGNHAVTYLELPKHLHKPAIVKYQVQIAPKVKGVPIEQEIAIMPPEGAGGERKPLVLLKQVVSKPTDEHIQVIVPKSESNLVNTPKVEVKGGHIDQETLNSQGQSDGQGQGQYQGQGQAQGQGQTQGQSQSQDQNQGQYQDQSQSQEQSQGQYQDQSQGQDQYQGQGQSQGQDQYQGQGQYEGQWPSQDIACGDLSACENYNPNMCNQVWMKRHCKKMCGLCTPQAAAEEETSFPSSPSKGASAAKPCEYSGVVHQSGETWSPGPCVPKCHCDDGRIKCSRLECPDLNCPKPVKRRWKCCPECLPNSDNETRCGVQTTGGNGEDLCCVFPFNYRGVDYFTCTTADAQEPWCSITRNYDRDGLWGNCVVKSNTGKKHVKQADSDEKTALVLAAQLSEARKWRNSTNNQVTDALKGLPSPLSEDDLQKLRAKNSASGYVDANKVYQNASGASNDISAQADYYRNAGVDLAQVAALDNTGKNINNYEAYQRNLSSSITSPVSSSLTPSPDLSFGTQQTQSPQASSLTSSVTSSVTSASSPSEQQPVYNTTYNSSNADAQSTGNPYSYQTTTRPGDKSSDAVGTYSDPGLQDNRVSYAGAFSDGAATTAEPNTGGSNTDGSRYSSYYDANNNQSGVSAFSGSYGQDSTAKDTANNYPSSVSSYSSSYGQESTAKDTTSNYPSGASAYSGSYGQEGTAKDTTDNTVPNGIENQTSYEMNPDASTAQYENNQPATT